MLSSRLERLEYAYADLVKLGGAVEVIELLELRARLALTGHELVNRYREGRYLGSDDWALT